MQLVNNHIRDFSPLPDHVSLSAHGQQLKQPGVATVGVPIDTGVRGLDGSALCLAWPPEGASCSNGMVTYTIPGHPLVTVTDPGASITTSWVQEVGPTGHLHATTTPTIYGSTIVSATLSASDPVWTLKPDRLTYQWYADGQPLASTSSYLFLHPSELGKRITACVTAHRDSFYDDQVCSAPSEPVTAWVPWPTGVIVNAPRPTITGRAKVGHKLEVMSHSWDQGVTFQIRWQRNGKDIKGARGDYYRLTRADLHKAIRVKITGSRPDCKPVVRYSKPIHPKR